MTDAANVVAGAVTNVVAGADAAGTFFARLYPGDAAVALAAGVAVQVAGVVVAAALVGATVFRRNPAARHAVWLAALAWAAASPLAARGLNRAGFAVVRIPPAATPVVDGARSPRAQLSREPSGSAAGPGAADTYSPASPADAHNPALADGAGTTEADATRSTGLQPVPTGWKPVPRQSTGSGVPQPMPPKPVTTAKPVTHAEPATHVEPATPAPVGTSDVFRSVLGAATAVWAAGVLILLARLAHGLRAVAKVRRSATPIDVPEAVRARVCRTLGVTDLPPVLSSPGISTPAAVGVLRPAVVLPVHLDLSDDELHDVLAHEVGHVRRRDYSIGIFHRMVATVLWPHPLVHLIGRGLRRAREEACDNGVLRGRPAAGYARTLLALAERTGASPAAAAGPALVGLLDDRWRLEHRVAGLLNPRRNVMARINRTTGIAVAAATVALGSALAATVGRAAEERATAPAPAAGSPAAGGRPPEVAPASQPAAAAHGAAAADRLSRTTLPGPEHLVIVQREYAVARDDLVSVELDGLAALPGKQVVKQARVAADGTIRLPELPDPVQAEGQSEAELERTITEAYRARKLLGEGRVTVQVAERRGASYTVVGPVKQPGRYAMPGPDLTLATALAMAGSARTETTAYVVRTRRGAADDLQALRDLAAKVAEAGGGPAGLTPTAARARLAAVEAAARAGGDPPAVVVSLSRLWENDPAQNVIIRPGDAIVVVEAEGAGGAGPATAPASQPVAAAPPAAPAPREVAGVVVARTIDVAARVDGVVRETVLVDGRAVKAGEVLVQLDDAEAAAQVRASEAELNLKLEKLKRKAALNDNAAAPVAELREAEVEVEIARIGLAWRKGELEKLATRAPFAGVVSRSAVEPGQVVAAGKSLGTVLESGAQQIQFDLPMDEAVKLKPGARVSADVPRSGMAAVTAEVTVVVPVVDPATRTVRVKARVIDPPADLWPGLFVRVRY